MSGRKRSNKNIHFLEFDRATSSPFYYCLLATDHKSSTNGKRRTESDPASRGVK